MQILTAPMAGVTDFSYRKILKKFDPDIIFTEMVSVDAIIFKNKKTLNELLKFDKDDSIVVQLFGNDPDKFLLAAHYIESIGIKQIDINMGCPVKKVVKNGWGAVLLNDLEKIKGIFKILKEKTNLKISVKVRVHKNLKEIINLASIYKLEFVTIHGRTKEQMYSGVANWNIIKEIKKDNKIKIIGNGDIFDATSAIEKINFSNVDGIMLARGIMGNPWLIKDISDILKNKKVIPEKQNQKIDIILEHFNFAIENKGEKNGVLSMRKHICWYLKNMPNSVNIKKEILKIEEPKNIIKILKEYKKFLKKVM